jgi:hypothetical protein
VSFNECRIFILCADLVAYQKAAEVCKHLLARFDAELDFSFNCWNFNELADPFCARAAMKIARSADVILLSLREAEMPPVLHRWLAALPRPRLKPAGALALVISETVGSMRHWDRLVLQLEPLARQIGLDFLPLGLTAKSPAMLPFQAATRPSQISDPPSCDHWGLNE